MVVMMNMMICKNAHGATAPDKVKAGCRVETALFAFSQTVGWFIDSCQLQSALIR